MNDKGIDVEEEELSSLNLLNFVRKIYEKDKDKVKRLVKLTNRLQLTPYQGFYS